ncbi:MAG: tetratricopeptide repeat protein, partial [Paracoccaceae bacterium]
GLTPSAALVTNLFSDVLSRSLSEQFSIEIADVSARSVAAQSPSDFVFSTEAMIQSGFTAFRVALEAGPRRRRIWFGHQVADGPLGEDTLDRDNLQRLVNEAVESYAEALLNDRDSSRDRLNASILGRTGVRQIFTMRPDLYGGADDLLDRAFCLDPRGIYLAWRVLLRVVQLVERHPVDVPATSAQAVELSRRAMEFEPLNSLVLSAASNVASLVEMNPHASVELAQRAVRLNRANPFGWDCLSTAALHVGKLEEAHVFAVKAQKLAGDTPFKHWYDMGRALTATVTGRLDEALSLAGAASVMPHFKPPLRYIAALHAHAGQPLAAQAAVARLTALEPDFSPDMMVGDPTYPVAALRRSEILRKGLFGNLH